jgi:pSer/pThr/pTyr-binding forkhead associated (FHA) protein
MPERLRGAKIMEPIMTKHLRGSKCGQTDWFELNPNEELTIGRDPSNKLAFHQGEDDLVGRKHAKIIRQADGFVIVDLNSRNGTFVNNERISGPTRLKSGDVIEFGAGGPRIQFYSDKEPATGPATRMLQLNEPVARPTRFISSGKPSPVESTARRNTGEPEQEPASITMKHLKGSKCGETELFELGANEELTIGRDPSNRLAFHHGEDDLVGRKHAKIIRHADGFVIIDLNSRNGTFINNERVIGPTLLTSGDVIEFGASGPRVQFCQGKESLNDPATAIPQLNELDPGVRNTLSAAVPFHSQDSSHTAVDLMPAQAPTLTARKVVMGVLALALFTATFIAATLYLDAPAQPPITGGQPELAKVSLLAELWHALGVHNHLSFFGGALCALAALLGLVIFRREH